jgi:hypothetical protein
MIVAPKQARTTVDTNEHGQDGRSCRSQNRRTHDLKGTFEVQLSKEYSKANGTHVATPAR